LIGAEFGREDHSWISAIVIGRGVEPLDIELTPNQIKLAMKAKRKKKLD
jgi:hypothetical protein